MSDEVEESVQRLKDFLKEKPNGQIAYAMQDLVRVVLHLYKQRRRSLEPY
jgi:hypothetical protein